MADRAVAKAVVRAVWAVGAVAVVAVPIAAVFASPDVPEGVTCWRDPEHDRWPVVRIVRKGSEIRVARRPMVGRYEEVAAGRAWFGSYVRGSHTAEVGRGSLVLQQARYVGPYSCAIDQIDRVYVTTTPTSLRVTHRGNAPWEAPITPPCKADFTGNPESPLYVHCQGGSGLAFASNDGNYAIYDMTRGTTTFWSTTFTPAFVVDSSLR